MDGQSTCRNFRQVRTEGRLPYSNEAILKFDDEKIHEITPNTENPPGLIFLKMEYWLGGELQTKNFDSYALIIAV